MSKRGLSDDELAVWENVTRGIKRLRPRHKAVALRPPEPAPHKAAAKAVAKAVVPAKPPLRQPAPKPPPAPPPLPTMARREKQRAARGHDAIDARLDLHGHTQDEAHAALLAFLQRSSAHEAKLVLVITGKSGVLRRQVPHWLATPAFRALVISAEAAAIRHGGDGALYIRVRRGR
jgi:DNA-nicking Smr family endonuclease